MALSKIEFGAIASIIAGAVWVGTLQGTLNSLDPKNINEIKQRAISEMEGQAENIKNEIKESVKGEFANDVAQILKTDTDFLNSTKKDIALTKRSVETLPIGTIIASMLTPETFEKYYGSAWILADGSKISSQSEYAKITDGTILPNLRGMFLRGINVGRTDGKQDPDGERAAGKYQSDDFKTHKHILNAFTGTKSDKGSGGVTSGNTEHGGQTIRQLPTMTTAGNATETRPKNAAVYFYIKVN